MRIFNIWQQVLLSKGLLVDTFYIYVFSSCFKGSSECDSTSLVPVQIFNLELWLIAEFVEVLSPTHLKMRVWERGAGKALPSVAAPNFDRM